MPFSPVQAVVLLGLGVESTLVQANFSGTITLGSILLGIMVLVAAGLFTIRSNVAKVWREEAEGQKERSDRLQEQLDEEREVRHALKNELVEKQALLLVEQAKPNLEVVAAAQKQTLEVLTQLATAAATAAKTDTKLDEIHDLVNSRLEVALREIALLKTQLGLPPEPIPE